MHDHDREAALTRDPPCGQAAGRPPRKLAIRFPTRYLVTVTPEPVIAPSARRHGVDDEDMLHAYQNATDAWALDEGLVMLIGPDRSGALLEIGVVRADDGTPVIVHAMKARPKFLR
jgi:hypothetical protein